MLTLTILGCDGSHVSAGGAASGYLVREWDSGTTIWLDAGPGTFANLQRFCDPRTVDAIVLTHLHGDHWTDIDGFLTAGRWTAKPPWGPGRVLAAPGSPMVSSRSPTESSSSRRSRPRHQGDGGTAHAELLAHRPWACHVRGPNRGRWTGARLLCRFRTGLVVQELGPGIDLALCEATYTEEYEGTAGHMSGRQAGINAREADVGRLLITHRSPVDLGRRCCERGALRLSARRSGRRR